jgi:hypothetical protein
MMICTPPNGSERRPRAWRSERSMASIRSALTIDTSSMTRVSIALSIRRAGSDCSSSLSAMRPIGSRKSEWIVCPRRSGQPPRRGADGDLLLGVPGEMLQQRRLAGARAPGHENVLARVLDEAEELLLLGGEEGCSPDPC